MTGGLRRRASVGLIAILALAGSVFAKPRIATNHLEGFDFTALATYAWLSGDPVDDELTHQRIENAIDFQLSLEGYLRVDEDPDFEIAYYASVKTETVVDPLGYAWRGLFGRSSSVRKHRVGTLIVDIVDGDEDRLLWTGTVSDYVSTNREANAETIKNATEALFERFPPPARSEP